MYDAEGGSHEAPLQNFCIGYPGDKIIPPVGEMDYEFPFIVAKGMRVTAVQFRQDSNSAVRSDSRVPTLTFDLSQLNTGE